MSFNDKCKGIASGDLVVVDTALLKDMLEFTEELMTYTPEYFATKWSHQKQYDNLKRRCRDE